MSSIGGTGVRGSPDIPRWLAWACRVGLVVLLLWAALRGFSEPFLGVADRGDFYRVGDPAGIVVPRPDLGHPRPIVEYALRDASFDATTTSAAAVAFGARLFPGPSGQPGTLDIRQVGFAYTALLGAALAISLWCGLSPVLALLVAWASVGPARLALQNSLLTEPAALVALSALVALLAIPGAPALPTATARMRRGVWAALVAFAALGGFARAAAALLPLTLVVAIAVTSRGGTWQGRGWRWPLAVACALAACWPLVHAGRGDAARFREINVYHAVFRGVTILSSDPPRVLGRLGVGTEHLGRVGSSYFDRPVPRELAESLARVSRADIALELLREPTAMGRALDRMTQSLAVEWTPGGGEVPRHQFEWWSVSSVHSLLFGAWPPLLWIACLGAAAWCLRRESGVRASALFLVLTVLSQLAITVLGDGLFALGRHLLLARAAFDLLCVLALGDAASRLLPRLPLTRRTAP